MNIPQTLRRPVASQSAGITVSTVRMNNVSQSLCEQVQNTATSATITKNTNSHKNNVTTLASGRCSMFK